MKNDLRTQAKSSLTQKEFDIFKMIMPKSGVLFLKGKPGIGKSAICRSIAKKLDMQYIDLRLSQMDETDLGLFPVVSNLDSGEKMLAHALPEWAIRCNQKPTIIHFEELNRASLPVRNAALQILNERTIGYNFQFNENVFMVSSGNKGETDGTTIEEFDSALKTRLLIKNYDLTLKEWIDNFAKENVNQYIVQYLDNKPSEFYKFNQESETYATPRGWTFLSDFIKSNVDNESNPKELLEAIYDTASCYVGVSATGFIRYLEDLTLISVKDILNRFDDVKTQVEALNMTRKTELLQELKDPKMNIEKLSEKVVNNINSFLQLVEDDQKVSFIFWIIDTFPLNQIQKSKINELIKQNKEVMQYVLES
jgi:hypothetical protein